MALLIDGDNLAATAEHVSDPTLDVTGRRSGAILSVLAQIRSAMWRIAEVAPAQVGLVVVAWGDERANVWRRKIDPNYKSARDQAEALWTPEERAAHTDHLRQMVILKELLPLLGVRQFNAPGYEADDIAGHLVRMYGQQADWVLVSNDSDWLQLIGPRVRVWRTRHKDLVDLRSFAEKAPGNAPDPDTFVRMKAIAGGKDDIPGVRGVGEVYALQYLAGTLKPGKRFDAIEEWMRPGGGYAHSLRMVDLRDVAIPAEQLMTVDPMSDGDAFFTRCGQLGFHDILDDAQRWLQPFMASMLRDERRRQRDMEAAAVARP